MPDVLIKEMPADLHEKLCVEAQKHRRTMTQEVLTILEKEMGVGAATQSETEMGTDVRDWPPPFKGKRLVTQSLITKGIREGRL